MKNLQERINKLTLFGEIQDAVTRGARRISVTGLSLQDEALFYCGLSQNLESPIVLVKEQEEAERLLELMNGILGERVAYLPKRNLLPYKTALKSRELLAQRLRVLDQIAMGKVRILLLNEEALLEKYISPNQFRSSAISLRLGDETDREALLKGFMALGFQKEPTLEERGQFSVRGDILDIWPMAEENPLRLDFFGDFLERIKVFDPEDQKTLGELETIELFPNTDLLPPLDLGATATKLLVDAKEEGPLREELELMAEGLFREENERFYPAFGYELCSILDYVPTPPILIQNDPPNLRLRAKAWRDALESDHQEGVRSGRIHPIQIQGYFEPSFLEEATVPLRVHTAFYDFLEEEADEAFLYQKRLISPFRGDMSLFIKELLDLQSRGREIHLLSSTKEKRQNLELFFEDTSLSTVGVFFEVGHLEESFELPELNLAAIGEKDLFGQIRRGSKEKRRKKLNPFTDIKVGDFVVHEDYGIALYKGIEEKEINGRKRDYLYLEFSGTGKLFVPVENMASIEKYIGSEGHRPRLSNLGNNEWRKIKEKVRISVSDIAKDLLRLYGERKRAKGFPYSKDGSWHEAFADRFPYLETEDQMKAIQDVRKDMEKASPMDRVIIGDVGYGKTEVALRAAFKAVMDGKQVAILSPTTVLSQQHYRTFVERFEGLPTTIGLLNRFVHKKDQNHTLKALAEGKVDILIGTHRILSGDVVYKDLGLLVIDEEQKFGVVHKEKIKNLKSNIDCLVLSATPIPRTLHMALAGARDLSVIETPPKERYPVQTYVMEQDGAVIRASILKELKRDGQVFFVYNKVQTMETRLKELKALVPEARIASAHGQMDEKTLESRMMGFLQGDIDVLLCTTIIENGLNIKNANTLIVEDADHLGLAQIYQLKGRVGRSNRIAYAYFMFGKHKLLTETARKRLKAIRELTELGAGFKIAMLDLEIRGAGNLLGREQHGHMLSVGFDLYVKILEDEVARLEQAEEQPLEPETVELILNVEAHIPSTYIEDGMTKLEIYKRIADLRTKEEMLLLMIETKERFGRLPEAVEMLFLLADIRILALKHHIHKIQREPKHYVLHLNPGSFSLEELQKIRRKFQGKVVFGENTILYREEKGLHLLMFFLRSIGELRT